MFLVMLEGRFGDYGIIKTYMSSGPERIVDEPEGHSKRIAQTFLTLKGHRTGFAKGIRDAEVGELRATFDVRSEVLNNEGMVQVVLCVVLVSSFRMKRIDDSGKLTLHLVLFAGHRRVRQIETHIASQISIPNHKRRWD